MNEKCSDCREFMCERCAGVYHDGSVYDYNIQSINTTKMTREEINELGRLGPYFKYGTSGLLEIGKNDA